MTERSIFDTPRTELAKLRRAERVDHPSFRRKINAVSDRTNALSRSVSLPQQIAPQAKRPEEVVGGGALAATIRPLRVTAHFDDYLEGKDDSLNPENVRMNVAKPWLLRRSSYDGKNIGGTSYRYVSRQRRVVTKGDITETQEITPKYLIGFDIILAQRFDGIGMQDDNGDDILWLVISDPRLFAELP